MKRLRRDREDSYPGDDETDIDIIPLVDVMFLLLTFFVFMTLAMVIQEGIGVNLASAQSGSSVKEQKPIVISIQADGEYHLGEEKTTPEDLSRHLESVSNRNKNRPVFLNVDSATAHRHVIGALDLVRKSGLSNVTFTVKPEKGKDRP